MSVIDELRAAYQRPNIIVPGGEAGDDGWGDEEDYGDGEYSDSSDGGFDTDSDQSTDSNPFDNAEDASGDEGWDTSEDDGGWGDDEGNDSESKKKSSVGKSNKDILADKNLVKMLRSQIPDAFKDLAETANINLDAMSDGFRNVDIDFLIQNYEETYSALLNYIRNVLIDDDDYSRTEALIQFRAQLRAIIVEYNNISDSISIDNLDFEDMN